MVKMWIAQIKFLCMFTYFERTKGILLCCAIFHQTCQNRLKSFIGICETLNGFGKSLINRSLNKRGQLKTK